MSAHGGSLLTSSLETAAMLCACNSVCMQHAGKCPVFTHRGIAVDASLFAHMDIHALLYSVFTNVLLPYLN